MRAQQPTPLLFIGGFGRSGSTLLECLLSRLEGVVVLGEVEHLWERGLQQNVRCACGDSFRSCEFWNEIGSCAFGSWERVDLGRVLALKHTLVRQRKLLGLARTRVPQSLAREVAEYCSYVSPIVESARRISGASVVVDSSKSPASGVLLTHDPHLDLRSIHLVRDSRGVAYSWSKTMTRPETAVTTFMPRYASWYSALQWSSRNIAMAALRRQARPPVRLRYEDLVADPAAAVYRTWRALGLPGDGQLPMVNQHTIELLPTHSIAGNPMRFHPGRTTVRPDLEWRTAMSRRDRLVVTALTLPLLVRWGYLPRTT